MTPDGERELISLLGRIAEAVERLAPPKNARIRHTAILGTAIYDREERERKELREKLKGKSGIEAPQAG